MEIENTNNYSNAPIEPIILIAALFFGSIPFLGGLLLWIIIMWIYRKENLYWQQGQLGKAPFIWQVIFSLCLLSSIGSPIVALGTFLDIRLLYEVLPPLRILFGILLYIVIPLGLFAFVPVLGLSLKASVSSSKFMRIFPTLLCLVNDWALFWVMAALD